MLTVRLILTAMKEKDAAAVGLGRKGGLARAKKLTKKRRREIAQHAAKTRWATSKERRKEK